MISRVVLILIFVFSFVFLGTSRQNAANPERPSSASRQTSMTSAQVQSLRDDLNRMRALVQQMETNLSFVDTTQSPLKHQFQLEIDMWKLTIQRMDSELQGSK